MAFLHPKRKKSVEIRFVSTTHSTSKMITNYLKHCINFEYTYSSSHPFLLQQANLFIFFYLKFLLYFLQISRLTPLCCLLHNCKSLSPTLSTSYFISEPFALIDEAIKTSKKYRKNSKKNLKLDRPSAKRQEHLVQDLMKIIYQSFKGNKTNIHLEKKIRIRTFSVLILQS